MLNKDFLSPKRRTQLSILLTVIALLLWSHSMLYARLEIGYFGLIHGLPITYFLALVFLTAASAILWLSREGHGRLLCLQLLFFVSILWLVPVITGGSHPFTDETYAKFGLAEYIVEAGHFSFTEIWYLAWPGAHILLAVVATICSISYEPLTPLILSFTMLLFFPPLYLFLKNLTGQEQSNYHWAGLWLFALAAWIGVVFPSPQGIGYFLLLTLLALVTTSTLREKNYKNLSLLALAVVLFASLVITHLLTALVALCVLAALCVVRLNKRLALVIAICLVLLVIWDFTGGAHYIQSLTSRPIAAVPTEPGPTPTEPGPTPTEPGPTPAGPGFLILDPDVITQREITGHFSGSASHAAVAKIRLLFSSIFAFIGFAGAILFLLVKRNFRLAISVLAISLVPLVLLSLSGYYAQELITRLYLFALPGMAFFGAMLLDIRSRIPVIILCILMVICYPLHIIAHYGNQEIDYVSPEHLAGMEFFYSTTHNGYIMGGYPIGDTKRYTADDDLAWGTGKQYRYARLGFASLDWGKNRLFVKTATREKPLYIAISGRDAARYAWFRGDDQFLSEIEKSLNQMVNCNLIYNNPALKLYVRDVPKRLNQ